MGMEVARLILVGFPFCETHIFLSHPTNVNAKYKCQKDFTPLCLFLKSKDNRLESYTGAIVKQISRKNIAS